MKVYDYITKECVEVSDKQYDFVECCIKHNGRLADVIEDFKISQEQLEEWKRDPIFWPVVEGHLTILWKSRGLTPEYVKTYLLETIGGKVTPTKAQMNAINASTRLLSMGMSPRHGLSGAITATPGMVKLEFNDGVDAKDTNS